MEKALTVIRGVSGFVLVVLGLPVPAIVYTPFSYLGREQEPAPSQPSQEPESGLWIIAVEMLALAAFLLWAHFQGIGPSTISG